MELKLKRIARRETYTIGHLYVDGKYVCDTVEDRDRGLSQSLPVSVNIAKKRKGMTAIPTGRYRVTLEVQSPKFSKYKAYAWCDGYLPRLINVPAFDGILIHCLTPETEILTEFGWQNLEQFKANTPEKCLSYNTNTQRAEFVPINYLVENDYNGVLYENNGKRINYSVTDRHMMYAGYKKRDGSYVWEQREAQEIPHNGIKFLTAALKKGEDVLPHQKAFYRLLMATVADGYILNWSSESSQVKFHFKKERKINRLKDIVREAGGTFKEFEDHVGKTHITLDPYISDMITEILNPYRLIQKDKNLPWDMLLLKGEDLKDLVMEYLFWDGRYENYLKNNKNMVISSTNIHNLDVLQAMATMGGMRAYIKEESSSDDKRKNCYALVLYEEAVVAPEPYTFSTREYAGKVWCLNNNNHTLFIRKNKRTMIIGNCGNSAYDSSGCILVGENKVVGKVLNSMVTLKRLYAILKAAKDNIYITIE